MKSNRESSELGLILSGHNIYKHMKPEMKSVPFTIICPEIKPGQGINTLEISVEVREEYGENIMTAEAIERIETIKMQMMLTRLVECVRELYAATGVLPSPEPKATEQMTAPGCTNSPNPAI